MMLNTSKQKGQKYTVSIHITDMRLNMKFT